MNCNNCPSPITTGTTLASTCPDASFFLFISILEYFIRRQCDLEDPCGRVSPRDFPESSYDFIVIGGGSAGAVVAARLSEESSFSVLLLEAGLDELAWNAVPSFAINVAGSKTHWLHLGVREKSTCLNFKEKRCSWSGGKVLGGTSVINGMMYMRGSQKDFNDWEKMGNQNWSFPDVLPFFKKSENNLQMDKMDSGYHSKGGPLPISQFNYHPAMSIGILKAAKELGYNTVDLNGKSHTGFAIAQTTSNSYSRFSTARAFLRPARNRKNLHVMLNSTVTKIILDDNKKAVAVELYKDGKLHRVGVTKEVVLSAGAVNSPRILLNSGIGPKEELEKVGVSVVHDLPGVGKNLHDHVVHIVTVSISDSDVSDLNWASAMDYLLFRKGPLTSTGTTTVTGMINTKYADPEEDNPDVQIIFGGLGANCYEPWGVKNNTISRRKMYLMIYVLRPKSRGYVRIQNNDPFSRPLISCNYFSHPYDIAVIVEGIKFALRLVETKALKKYDMQVEKTPVKNCEHLEFGSDAYWECAVRHNTLGGCHLTSSCKMGPDSDKFAVVDNELRLKGIEGVRVADASIMPEVTSGNTNAPVIMIGERAADFIKKTWTPGIKKCF